MKASFTGPCRKPGRQRFQSGGGLMGRQVDMDGDLKFSLEKEIKPQPERSGDGRRQMDATERSEMDEHLYSKTESNAHG